MFLASERRLILQHNNKKKMPSLPTKSQEQTKYYNNAIIQEYVVSGYHVHDLYVIAAERSIMSSMMSCSPTPRGCPKNPITSKFI